MAEPIRVLLVDLPRIPRELIEHAVADAPDMIVVGSTPDIDEFEAATDATEPEFVIVGLDDSELPPPAERYIDKQSHLKVVGVEARDGIAYLFRLRPERASLGGVSPADVVDAIRAAASQAEEGPGP